MRAVDLPPDAATLMTATRAIGYSLPAAIADVVDNSITACASIIRINYHPQCLAGPYISILDNGCGMAPKELEMAMRYGSKDPSELRDPADLGRFGLGLKMASMSQCKKLTVLTKKDGDISGSCWDLDYIIKANKGWSLLLLSPEDMADLPMFQEFTKLETGTLVIWQELDRLAIVESDLSNSMSSRMGEVCQHFSLVYHRYLSGSDGLNKISVFFNEEPISPIDPFFTKKSNRIMDVENIKIRGENIAVTAYVLPHQTKLTKQEIDILGGSDGLRRNQGFYIYRNKRLLVWGTWFRLLRKGELTKLSRVQIDIPNSLDDLWTLDVKKSTASPPEIVRKNLKNIVDHIAGSSKRKYTFRGKKETSDRFIRFWNRIVTREGLIYSINREHPFVVDLIKDNPKSEKNLEELLKQIEANLPLNSLYTDSINDKIIENEVMNSESDVILELKEKLSHFSSIEEKKEIATMLKNIEPYCRFLNAIEIAEETGELL